METTPVKPQAQPTVSTKRLADDLKTLTEAEKTLYERLKALTERGGGALLSIAHRPSVAPFHKRRWQLVAQPEGAPARYRVETAPIG